MREIFEKLGYSPRSGVWELTLRCNLDCLHCGSRAGTARGEELSLEEMLRLADDLVELGNQQMTLSGGEPLLYAHWPDIARRLTDGGVRVNMISNGYAFDQRQLDRGRESGLRNFVFSVDGLQAMHNHIRGRDDAFARVMGAIDLCAREGYRCGVNSHVNRANMGQLDALARTLIGHGAFAWQVQLGFDAGNMSDHPELVLEPDDLEQIIPEIARLKRRYAGTLRIDAADDVGYYTEDEELFRSEHSRMGYWIGCRAGLQVIGIEANGNIKGCLSMQADEFVEGNVREQPLRDIWFGEGNFAYTRQFTVDQLGGYCRRCKYATFCRGGCSWNAYLHGRGTGKYCNRYCLHQIRELKKEERERQSPSP